MRRNPRTLYMHTLDGKPASFGWTYADEKGQMAYIHFVNGHTRGKLAASLRQIRREQRLAINAASARGQTHWANPRLYGYVLVAVPQEKNDNG